MRWVLVCIGIGACGEPAAETPIVIAMGEPKPWAVAVDDARVYWTNLVSGGSVMAHDKRGASASPLASGQPSPARLAVDASSVFFTNAEGGTVRKVPIAGGAPVEIATGGMRPARIAVDATHAYWTDEELPGVFRVELPGGTPTALAMATTELPTGIAIDDDAVYFGDAGTQQVSRVMKDGSGLEVIASGEPLVQDLAIDANGLYWVSGSGWVKRWDSGTRAVTTVVEELRLPRALALDANHVYITTSIGNEVIRVPKTGGAREVLANDECAPFGIAVDATRVYWAATDCGEIRSMTK